MDRDRPTDRQRDWAALPAHTLIDRVDLLARADLHLAVELDGLGARRAAARLGVDDARLARELAVRREQRRVEPDVPGKHTPFYTGCPLGDALFALVRR